MHQRTIELGTLVTGDKASAHLVLTDTRVTPHDAASVTNHNIHLTYRIESAEDGHLVSAGNSTAYMRQYQIAPAEGKRKQDLDQFLETWDRWAGNDHRPGCVHATELGWIACAGHETGQGTHRQTCGPTPEPWPDAGVGEPPAKIARAVAYLEEFGFQINRLKRPNFYYCGEDMAGSPCPTCGNRFGESWHHEEPPPDVLIYLENWGLPPAVK